MPGAEDRVFYGQRNRNDRVIEGLVGDYGPYGGVEVEICRHIGESEEEDSCALEVRAGGIGHSPGVFVDFWEKDRVMMVAIWADVGIW